MLWAGCNLARISGISHPSSGTGAVQIKINLLSWIYLINKHLGENRCLVSEWLVTICDKHYWCDKPLWTRFAQIISQFHSLMVLNIFVRCTLTLIWTCSSPHFNYFWTLTWVNVSTALVVAESSTVHIQLFFHNISRWWGVLRKLGLGLLMWGAGRWDQWAQWAVYLWGPGYLCRKHRKSTKLFWHHKT